MQKFAYQGFLFFFSYWHSSGTFQNWANKTADLIIQDVQLITLRPRAQSLAHVTHDVRVFLVTQRR